MGRIDVVLTDELERKFREEVVKRLGFKKGNISIAIEEAIKDWLNKKSGKMVIAGKKAWLTRRENAES
ncbi:MAG: hypothetical protein HYZ54_07230 [Ignavibacteriae bacterium]|nr:hypothetical protein [Ignavibacteriota bacterium]